MYCEELGTCALVHILTSYESTTIVDYRDRATFMVVVSSDTHGFCKSFTIFLLTIVYL